MAGFKTSTSLRRLLGPLVVGTLVAVAAACGARDQTATQQPGPDGTTPAGDRTLVVRLAQDPERLQWAFSADHFDTPSLVMATSLVALDPDGEPVPRLAESWQVSEDMTEYTFTLKERTWSDGEPVTSEDVKFTVEEVLRQYNPWGSANFSAVEDITTPDPRTVTFHLEAPQDLFPVLAPMYGPIVPRHVYEGTDILDNPANQNPVVAGPYMLGEHARGSHTTLVRNPEWTGDEPHFDRIIFRVIPQADTAVVALNRGEIDIIPQYPPISPRDVIAFESNPNFQVVPVASPFGDQDTLHINGYAEPVNDARVRQAIAYAIDPQAIVDAIYVGTVEVADGHTSHQGLMSGYAGDFLEKYRYDPEMAESLLDEAGYPVGPDGTRFTLRFTAPNDFPAAEFQDAIVGYLGEVGIAVEADLADFSTHWSRVYEWSGEENAWNGYHLALMLSKWTAPPNLKSYYHSSRIMPGTLYSNVYNLQNPEFDAAIDRALASVGEEHEQAMIEAQEILAEEMPTYPITSILLYQVADNSIQGLPMGHGLFLETPLPPYEVSRE